MADTSSTRQEHWARTKKLTIITLALWFFFGFIVHWFAVDLNSFSFLGFPLGFYMAGQGAQIAFVLIIFWFSYAQNKIDEECGVAEDED